jgi:hypothetical protein
MRFLTPKESNDWLERSGFVVDRDHGDAVVEPAQVQRLMVDLPNGSVQLSSFAERLIQWLPAEADRMLWLSYWNTYPAWPLAVFERVRRGCGESRHVIEAPGHVVDAFPGGNAASNESDESNESDDNAMLSGLVFLTLCFDWRGYLVAQMPAEYIVLGDAFVGFCAASDERLKEAESIAHTFELKTRRQVR